MIKSLKSWVVMKIAERHARSGLPSSQSEQHLRGMAGELRVSYRTAREAVEAAVMDEQWTREAMKTKGTSFEVAIKKVLERQVYYSLKPQSECVRDRITKEANMEVMVNIDAGGVVEIIVACDEEVGLC